MNIWIVTNLLASFSTPMDIHTTPWDLLWAIPICICIAAVYKAVKLDKFETRNYLREVVFLSMTLVGFLILSAIVLVIVAKLVRQL